MNIEPKLLHACKKRDRKAQFQLYKSCFSLLMGVCIRYKRDEAEARSILNVGFLKILTNLEKYNTKVPFEAWIRRIMINTIIDEFRKNRKERELIDYTDFGATDRFNQQVDYNEADKLFDVAAIEHLIKQLPSVTQKVFNLYIIDGYSHKEISKMLQMSVGTSKWHLSNARKILKSKLQKSINASKSTI